MLDIVNGKIRVRKWPRGRSRKPTLAQQAAMDKFAAVQSLSRYIDPTTYTQIVEATDKTPLLPRDMIGMMVYGTAAMFVLEDGRKLFPMPFRKDVSEALDAISQTEGQILYRGPDGWMGIELPQGGGGIWPETPQAENMTPWATDGALPTVYQLEGAAPVIRFGANSGSWQFRGMAMDPAPIPGDFTAQGIWQGINIYNLERRVGIYVANRAQGKLFAMLMRFGSPMEINFKLGDLNNPALGDSGYSHWSGIGDEIAFRLGRSNGTIFAEFGGNGTDFQRVLQLSAAQYFPYDITEWGFMTQIRNGGGFINNGAVTATRWLTEQ